MIRTLIGLMAALAALATLVVAPAGATSQATVNIGITKAGFVPKDVTIKIGDVVTWTNSDTVDHQVVSQDAGFASPILKPTQTFSYTFTKAGKFTFDDPLAKNFRGTVTVTAAPTPPPGQSSVTLAAAPTVVTYGGKVTLSGKVSTGAAGESVTIYSTACGSTQQKGDTVTTTTGGAFSLAIQPLKTTSYQVRWKNATSTAVTVKVKPRVRLGRLTPTRFTLRVYASDSFAGRYAVIQRFNAATSTWLKVRTTTLRANATGVAPTVISSVTFTAKVKARTRLRAVLLQSQVGSCYLAANSNAVVS